MGDWQYVSRAQIMAEIEQRTADDLATAEAERATRETDRDRGADVMNSGLRIGNPAPSPKGH